jgi:hypothetical protein
MKDQNDLNGFYRLWHIIGSKKKGIPALYPVGATTWWNMVKSGEAPAAVKLAERTTAWRKSEIHTFLDLMGGA